MKKIFLLFTIYYLLFTKVSLAASPTPDSTNQFDPKILNQFRDQVASTVAKLNLVEKRGIIGTVTDVTGTQITLTDTKGDTRFVDVDELTKFIGGPKDPASFGISDIKKDSTLGILGLYNKQSRRILARTVSVITIPKMIHGSIATIDSNNFILNVSTDKNEQLQVEFETTTKTFSYDKKIKDLAKSGFSKIVEGEKIFIIGFPDKLDKNKIIADRIMVFPEFVKSPKIEATPTIVPSTGSGKKLTPIVK